MKGPSLEETCSYVYVSTANHGWRGDITTDKH